MIKNQELGGKMFTASTSHTHRPVKSGLGRLRNFGLSVAVSFGITGVAISMSSVS